MLKWMWQPESWSQIEMWVPGVNSPGCLQVSREAKKKSPFKDSNGVSSKGLWGLKGSWPILSPWKTWTRRFSRRMWGWGCVSSKFIALSSLIPAPHNLGAGWGEDLTNRFEPCNLLKMLMRKERTPGSIKVLTCLEMCLNLSGAVWYIYQAIFQACWVSLKMQQALEPLDIMNRVV